MLISINDTPRFGDNSHATSDFLTDISAYYFQLTAYFDADI